LASSTDLTADYSVGVLLARNGPVTNVVDVKRVKLTYPELRALIIATAEEDGTGVTIAIERVGMQKAICDDLIADPKLSRFKVRAHQIQRLGKLERAMPLTSRFESGSLRLCNGSWNDAYIEEMCGFSGDDRGHDDQCDGTSGAWAVLNVQPMFVGIPTKAPDMDKKVAITMIAVEIMNFTAYMVKALWDPHKEIMRISGESVDNTVEGMAAYMKGAKRRLGSKELEGDSLKNIQSALSKGGASVVTGLLDVTGAAYWINASAKAGLFSVDEKLRAYSEMVAASREGDRSPFVDCVLRLAQETRTWKKLPEKEWAPFEKARFLAKAENDRQVAGAVKEWAG